MNVSEASQLWADVDVGRELYLFSPMIALVCTMLAVVACPIILGRSARTIGAVVGVGILVTFYYCLKVAGVVSDGGVSALSPGGSGGMLIADNLSTVFQIVLVVFMAGIYWMWRMGSAQSEKNAPEFFILLLGSAFGMVLMVSTVNLLLIVVAIEAASLPSYAIVGFDKGDRKAAEASLKYVVFGAVCAAIMLYGASVLYGLVGSLDMGDIARALVSPSVDSAAYTNRSLLLLALLSFFAGIAFKISAVPFHFWCPDAFEGAKIEVTTWLSVASKAAGLILLARLVSVFCHAVEYEVNMSILSPLAWTIGIMAAVTCTVGNFSAYKQDSVKRMLAYSSIAHAGYMMMACAVFLHPSSQDFTAGIMALLVYIAIYVFMNLGAFGVTAMIVWDTGNDSIDSFSGLSRRAPWLAVPMVICLMSLVGLPPLAGFIGKWWILIALGSLDSLLGWCLIIVVVLNTLISLYYYMRIVVVMALRDDGRTAISGPIGGYALANICGIALLALFVFAQPLKSAAQRYSNHLYAPANQTQSEWSSLAQGTTETP